MSEPEKQVQEGKQGNRRSKSEQLHVSTNPGKLNDVYAA